VGITLSETASALLLVYLARAKRLLKITKASRKTFTDAFF
jgi:hypothetical protein